MGQRRRNLIAVAQHERIEEIEADSGYADDDLPFPPGVGSGTTSMPSFSGPPNSLNCTTRMLLPCFYAGKVPLMA